MKTISFTKNKDKYIFCKDGIYFSLTLAQIADMVNLCNEILSKQELPPATQVDG